MLCRLGEYAPGRHPHQQPYEGGSFLQGEPPATILILSAKLALGQTPTSIVIDVQDLVEYQDDIGDPSKYGLNPGITPSRLPRNFVRATLFGDIVAVNGQPAKGLYAGISRQTSTSRNPSPGGAIADLSRIGMREIIVEILKPDGTPVGTIMSSGFSGSEPPSGHGLSVE